jgi:hypothetical protein
MSAVRYIDVTEPEQMQTQITHFVAQGYVVASQNNRSVTLIKRKKFSVLMLVFGFFFFVFPLFIYLFYYAAKKDQVVEIRLVESAAPEQYRASDHVPIGGSEAPRGEIPVLQLSPDRQSWWDGAAWQPTSASVPPQAVRHDDGRRWWDGEAWRQLPAASSR